MYLLHFLTQHRKITYLFLPIKHLHHPPFFYKNVTQLQIFELPEGYIEGKMIKYLANFKASEKSTV